MALKRPASARHIPDEPPQESKISPSQTFNAFPFIVSIKIQPLNCEARCSEGRALSDGLRDVLMCHKDL